MHNVPRGETDGTRCRRLSDHIILRSVVPFRSKCCACHVILLSHKGMQSLDDSGQNW